MNSSRLALATGVALLLAGARRASAQTPPVSAESAPATITVNGDCPSGDTIWTDVRSIVSAGDLARLSDVRIEVSDLGSTYRVRIFAEGGERQRTFHDLGHVCDHRARFVAVFIVVTLLPPEALLATPPELPPTPPIRIESPPSVSLVALAPVPAPAPKRFQIALSALLDAAAGSSDSEATAPGGEVRAYWGAGVLSAMAGLGVQPRASFDFAGIGIDELRVPLDVGIALVHSGRRLTLLGELSLAGALVRISGTNTAGPQTGTRLNLGGRIGVGVRFGSPTSRLVPIVGLHALVFPKPYEATATPEGDIGQLPAVWIGLTAGLSLSP